MTDELKNELGPFFKAHIQEIMPGYETPEEVKRVKEERKATQLELDLGQEAPAEKAPANSGVAPVYTRDVDALNKHNLSLLGPTWALNYRKNGPAVEASFACGPHSLYDYRLPEGVDPGLVALISSGPSLNRHLGELTRFPGLIVCGATALSTLLANGVKPHVVCVIDKAPVLAEKILEVPEVLRRDLDLWCTPAVDPSVLLAFAPEHRWYFHAHIDGMRLSVCPACKHEWAPEFEPLTYEWNVFNQWTYPEFITWALQAGCVGNMMVQLVGRLQDEVGAYNAHTGELTPRVPTLPRYARILLYGYDFSYPAGRARCTQYAWRGPEDFEELPEAPLHLSNTAQVARDAWGRDVLTDLSQLAYKRNLMTWIFLTWNREDLIPQIVLDLSGGVIGELPKVANWEDALVYSPENYTAEGVNAWYEEYLQRIGVRVPESAGREGRDLVGPELDIAYWRKGR